MIVLADPFSLQLLDFITLIFSQKPSKCLNPCCFAVFNFLINFCLEVYMHIYTNIFCSVVKVTLFLCTLLDFFLLCCYLLPLTVFFLMLQLFYFRVIVCFHLYFSLMLRQAVVNKWRELRPAPGTKADLRSSLLCYKVRCYDRILIFMRKK